MITKGIIAGIIFGLLDMAPMLFIDFPDKIAAITGAFVGRFAIGLLIFTSDLGINKIWSGVFIGVMLSIPDALITKIYVPILGTGIIGGLIIGYIASRQKKS